MASSIQGGSVVWDFDVNDQKFTAGVAKASAEAKALGTTLNSIDAKKLLNNMEDGFNSVANTIKKVGITLGLVAGAAGFFAVKTASDFEQSRIAFDTMLGSSEAARKMMQNLSDFAIKTPFTLPEVVTGAKQLLAYGISAENILPDLKALGDISAGVGRDKLPFLTLAFGQVATKGKLAGQEIRQFTEAGVPLVAELAKTLGKTKEEITKMSEEGQISFEDVRKALQGMTGEGGRFFNLMEKQSHTFGGVMSNIQDQIGRVTRSVLGISESGDIAKGSIFEKLKNAAQALLDWLNSNTEQIKRWASLVIDNFGTIGAAIAGLAAGFVALKVAVIGVNIAKSVVGVIQFVKAIKAGTGAMAAFNAVSALNPFVAIGIAIVALVGGLVFLQLKFGILTKAFENLKPVIEPVVNIFKDLWDSITTIAKAIGEQLAPVFQFVTKHIKAFAIALGVALLPVILPIVAPILAFVAGLKLLSIVLGFVADHIQGFIKIVKIGFLVAFAPLIAIIAPIVLLIKNFGAIMSWLGDVFSTVGGAIADVAGTIKNAVVTAWQFIYSVTVTVFTAIWNVLKPILDFIKNLFIIVFGSILIVILTVLQFIKDAIVNAVTFWWNIISTVLGFIWNVVQTVWNAIYGVISSVLGFIWERLVNAFNFYKDLIVNVFTAVWNFISGIWNQIYAVISGIVGRIIDFFRPAFNWLLERGKDIIRGLVSGISAVAHMVWDAIKAAADQIGKFFSGAASWLFETGKAIVQGLINGIKHMVGAVGDAAASVANTVKDKVKGLLGIHSPSSVMAGYGKSVMEGMAMGIEDNQKVVQNALTSLGGADLQATMTPVVGQEDITGGATSPVINHIGTINIGNEVDGDAWLNKLTRQDEIGRAGLVAGNNV